eukprot:2979863-Prymnesium_polylepis.1
MSHVVGPRACRLGSCLLTRRGGAAPPVWGALPRLTTWQLREARPLRQTSHHHGHITLSTPIFNV